MNYFERHLLKFLPKMFTGFSYYADLCFLSHHRAVKKKTRVYTMHHHLQKYTFQHTNDSFKYQELPVALFFLTLKLFQIWSING